MAPLIRVRPSEVPLRGTCRVPGDKSISHRALLLGALAEGTTHITHFLNGRDCQATLHVVRELGVTIDVHGESELTVHGVGLNGLREPANVLDCVNSGTTMRLLAGLLAAQPFFSVLTGTKQLRGRPMARVADPLRMFGASILGRSGGRLAPLAIQGGKLDAIQYDMPVASAQVKSALLLAGLYADGTTRIVEPGPTRDHTERMLAAMGAPVRVDGPRVSIERPSAPLRPLRIDVPGDPSSAAFLAVAAACCEGADISIRDVGTNPTRCGLIESLREMGAIIELENARHDGPEPVADLRIRHAPLRARSFGGDRIVTMIDEIPILAVAATQAQGTTVIRDARELRVKETDRIATTVEELRKMGAEVEPRDDGLTVTGPAELVGADVDSHGDHRLAMALAVAGLRARGETRVHGAEVTVDSFPGFEDVLSALGADVMVE